MIKKVRFSFYQSSNKMAEGHFKNVFDYETKFEKKLESWKEKSKMNHLRTRASQNERVKEHV